MDVSDPHKSGGEQIAQQNRERDFMMRGNATRNPYAGADVSGGEAFGGRAWRWRWRLIWLVVDCLAGWEGGGEWRLGVVKRCSDGALNGEGCE